MPHSKMRCPLCGEYGLQHEVPWGDIGPREDQDHHIQIRCPEKGPVGRLRNRECDSCHGTWNSIELPNEFVDALVTFFKEEQKAAEAVCQWSCLNLVEE